MIDPAPNADDATRIVEVAQRLVAERSVGDEPLRLSANIGRALRVLTLGDGLASWFVPVTVGDRLAAFFQIKPDGTLMRFSSFQRRAGEFAECPPAADWLDLDRIRTRGAAERRADETPGEPVLTYDRTPDRIVWAVPLTNGRGEVRYVYVAGGTVYSPPSGDAYG